MYVSRQVDTDFCFLFSPFLISVKLIVSNILGLMFVCTYLCMYVGIHLLLIWKLHKYLWFGFFLLFLNQTFILSIDLHTIVRIIKREPVYLYLVSPNGSYILQNYSTVYHNQGICIVRVKIQNNSITRILSIITHIPFLFSYLSLPSHR